MSRCARCGRGGSRSSHTELAETSAENLSVQEKKRFFSTYFIFLHLFSISSNLSNPLTTSRAADQPWTRIERSGAGPLRRADARAGQRAYSRHATALCKRRRPQPTSLHAHLHATVRTLSPLVTHMFSRWSHAQQHTMGHHTRIHTEKVFRRTRSSPTPHLSDPHLGLTAAHCHV